MTLSGTRWDVLRNMSPTVWFLHLASKLHQRRWTNLRAILENILLMISIINYFPVVFIWAIILQATAGGFFPNNNYYFCSFAIWVWMGLLCCAVENTGKSRKYTVPVSRHCDTWYSHEIPRQSVIYEVESVISSKTRPDSSQEDKGIKVVKLVLVAYCSNGREQTILQQTIHFPICYVSYQLVGLLIRFSYDDEMT